MHQTANSDIYLPEPATLVESDPLTEVEKFFRFSFDRGGGHSYLPGQFYEISVPGIGEAPISITSSPSREGDETFEMVVRKVGSVTNALHTMEEGARVGVRGPFGTSFPVEDAMKGQDVLFICGGIGLVPVRSAIEYVLDRRANYGNVTILFGARSPADRLFVHELATWRDREDVTFDETVDVGDSDWHRNVGVITTLIPKLETNPGKTIAIICGPPVMYKFVLLELAKLRIPPDRIYVSLERHMRCGVGKCGHCQINGLYACQDGPVFQFSEIQQIKEAI